MLPLRAPPAPELPFPGFEFSARRQNCCRIPFPDHPGIEITWFPYPGARVVGSGCRIPFPGVRLPGFLIPDPEIIIVFPMFCFECFISLFLVLVLFFVLLSCFLCFFSFLFFVWGGHVVAFGFRRKW